ncbi:MAG: NifB/NifX family molybdenum-iron cluster-binding protein [Candidatus Cryosericum sp.]
MARRQIVRRCEWTGGPETRCTEAYGASAVLGADEMEALRLSDLMGIDQTEAAARMGVSQSTFHRILAVARRKVAASFVLGRSLTIARAWDENLKGTEADATGSETSTGGTRMVNRIALPTDDGTTLCPHFGRAHYYKVVEITDGKVTASELRDKFAHMHGEEGQGGAEPSHDQVHGMMSDAAHGCDTLIVGGMGPGAIDAMTAAGYTVMQTNMTNIDEIIEAFRTGTFVSLSGQVSPCDHKGDGHGNC